MEEVKEPLLTEIIHELDRKGLDVTAYIKFIGETAFYTESGDAANNQV